MTYTTEADLHALLDSLTHGEHVKATWVYNTHRVTVEGLVYKNDLCCSCFHTIRCTDGSIESSLTSLEVVREEEVTATRDDFEEALHELLDSLTDGQEVTAEWRDANGSMVLAGTAVPSRVGLQVRGPVQFRLRYTDGRLHETLHSVTARLPDVLRWEREGDE